MLAEIGPFQALLDAIGWLLAWLYDLTGNFGFAIIILTIVFRVVLLPLGIKQIKSMQAMQALGPKIKEIQKKNKGNKQKAQEQTMALYQEYGVNPLGGCLPLLLQFPILIAMYAVIRAPVPYAETDPAKPAGVDCVAQGPNDALPPACYKDNHYPEDSQLFIDVTQQDDEHMHFLLMNLQCTPSQSGKTVPVLNTLKEPSGATLDCGDSIPDRIPYFAAARPHDRIDLLLESPDAEGDARICAEPADADHHEGHAADVRCVRLRLPGGPDPVLDHVKHLPDRAAGRDAPARTHRAPGDGQAPRAGEGEELRERRREETQNRDHGQDDGAGRSGAEASCRRARTAPKASAPETTRSGRHHQEGRFRPRRRRRFREHRRRLREAFEGWVGGSEAIRTEPPEAVREVDGWIENRKVQTP